MPAITNSPLGMLFQQSADALGARLMAPSLGPATATPGETVQQIAGGLLVAMGFKEIADDLDLEAVALLGAAAVAGLQKIGELEPGLHRLEDALYSFEDLLRRTAERAR